ncbi:hypothetical protein IZU27_06360 [Treponema socranskii]|uniref:hypothetical protein n=1 Tax=Treponema socranskii TaxID=53419 RepID=UPI003D90ED84
MVSFLIKCGIEPYDIPFSIVSPAGGEHGMRGGVSVMKKSIFAAAAIFFGFVFLSCSDVFGGRETEGIAFTVPPLAPQSASSPARAAAGVIILMDDIDVSGALPSISTSGNGVDHSVDFASISGKRCKLKAKDFSVSSGRYLSFTDVRIEGTVSPTSSALVDVSTGGELRLGGAVTLEAERKIQLKADSVSLGQNGKIVVTSPLAHKVGEVIVQYQGVVSSTEDEEKAARTQRMCM